MNSALPQMIVDSYDIIYNIRIQNYHEGCNRFRTLLGQIKRDSELCLYVKDILPALLDALEQDDEILLADLLEDGLIPIMKELAAHGNVGAEEIHGEYQVELTASGLLTVKDLSSGLYLHSNNNPMEEARILVSKCFDAQKKEYVVWGSGLGYHVLRLYELTRGAVPIRVFEESRELLQLAFERGVLSHIPADKLICEDDAAGHKFAAYIREHQAGILLHYPSVKKIKNTQLRNVMQNFYASWNGTIQFREELAINYSKNLLSCHHYADELESMFEGKEVVIVGGGPSLDDNLEFLKISKGKRVIAAVTTVWGKLLRAGIKPDVVFVMDSQKRTYGHMAGVEDTTTPLVLDSTAYWEFAANYPGPKYLACQEGYPEAEKLAAEKKLRIYQTGGSVTTLALDVALKLGASTVFLVGVDLAYPGGNSHASGTMDARKRSLDTLHSVKAQDGSITYSDELFEMYRKWIEQKIAEYPDKHFYNMAHKGAYIEGADLWTNK